MSEPMPEHVEALRDEVSGWPIGSGYYATSVGSDEAWEIAERLLTSTDPAVLDALQDALVRAGRLRESLTVAWDDDQPDMSGQPQRARAGSFRNRETADRAVAYYRTRGRVVESRLVTDWREVES